MNYDSNILWGRFPYATVFLKKTPLPPRPRSPQRGKISRGSELIPGNAAVPLTPMLTGPQEEWCISDGMKISDGRCFMIFPKSLVERAAFKAFHVVLRLSIYLIIPGA